MRFPLEIRVEISDLTMCSLETRARVLWHGPKHLSIVGNRTHCASAASSVRSRNRANIRRVYSLQRLVDVADANVAVRPRLAWNRVWRVLASHFARAGAHANADVARHHASRRAIPVVFLRAGESVG